MFGTILCSSAYMLQKLACRDVACGLVVPEENSGQPKFFMLRKLCVNED